MRQISTGVTIACMTLCCVPTVLGQPYPSKPIRMVSAEIGGGADFLARLLAQGISNSMRQQVVVDNRAGSTVIPVELVANAVPNGYTILFFSNSVWATPLLQKVAYDPQRDLSPITLAVSTPNVVAVHPSVPVTSVAELIALAKREPGKLNYAAGAFGSGNHLAAELFKYMSGVNMVLVPYKGGGPSLNAAVAGEVSVIVVTATSLMPLVRSGKLRGLGVTSRTPSALAPGLPTVAATVPGYESALKFVAFAPAGTPTAIIDRLNSEMVRFLKSAEAGEQLFKAGAEPVASSPQELAAWIKTDMSLMSRVIKEAGIKSN